MSRRKHVSVSLAEARDKLGEIIKDSQSGPIEITRRGEPVAVVVSLEDFRRRPALWEAIQNIREQAEAEDGLFEENPFAQRDRD